MYVYIYIYKIYCVCLDCIENRLCLVSAFFSWILCTVYGTSKYEKKKSNFKTGSHDIIYVFKNYFVTVFSVINFQFSIISVIQIQSIVFSV